MIYFSDIQEKEDGSFMVLEEHRFSSRSKLVRYRINIPGDTSYVAHLGPYAVEEKIGRCWIKIGVLSPSHPISR
jgi:hypothetical protein